ncbi:MAG: tetratricopeptide repeat protein, partial [Bacteroidia bacterium]|nr:tetratricopeptide repeat protein [Bacteroidia bacterium]
MEEVHQEELGHEEVQEGKKKKAGFDVQDKVEQAEFFFSNNTKIVSVVAIVFVLLVGGFVAYKFWYMPGQEEDAQKEAFYSALDFEKDSLNIAVKGGVSVRTSDGVTKKTMGLEAVAEEFGSTKTGKLANYQLGCAYMRQGKFELAIEKFNEFDSDDIIVSAIA